MSVTDSDNGSAGTTSISVTDSDNGISASNKSPASGVSLPVTASTMREQSYKAALKRLRARDFEAEKAEEVRERTAHLEDAKTKPTSPMVLGWMTQCLVEVMASDPDQTCKDVRKQIKTHYGVSCFKCHRSIGDTVYFRRRTWKDAPGPRVIPVCDRCQKEEYIYGNGECVSCGRQLVYVDVHDIRLHVCSEYCRNRYLNSKRANRTEVVCEHCGETFQQKRADSKYCSSKCRQKAYRERSK